MILVDRRGWILLQERDELPAIDLTASASIAVPGFLDSAAYASMTA